MKQEGQAPFKKNKEESELEKVCAGVSGCLIGNGRLHATKAQGKEISVSGVAGTGHKSDETCAVDAHYGRGQG
jgi:hypothetical protein